MSERKQHVTLEQVHSINEQGGVSFLVTETRNTIRFRIGQVLTAKEVEDLAHTRVEFTVKQARVR